MTAPKLFRFDHWHPFTYLLMVTTF